MIKLKYPRHCGNANPVIASVAKQSSYAER